MSSSNLQHFAVILLLTGGCVSAARVDYQAMMAQYTPASWQQPGAWSFEVVDRDNRSLGQITLLLTGEKLGKDSCGRDYWNKAVVVADSLDFDFGIEIQPAYSVTGRWLSVDLTSGLCDIDHIMYGNLEDNGAAGFFNFAHPLGGYNIGKFIASPVKEWPVKD